MKLGRGEVIVTSGCIERRMPVVMNNKVPQLTTTMAQKVNKRMAWYIQLVGLVLNNIASLVVAK